MNRKHFRSRTRAKGQGLVEYAIIIALVALVSIVILGLIGMAANKQFGIICAIFGCRVDHVGDQVLAIDRSANEDGVQLLPICAYYPSMGQTLVYAAIYSTFPPNEMTVTLDTGEVLPIDIAASGELGGADDRFSGVTRYKATKTLPGQQVSQCPKAVVAQASNVTIMAPITVRCYDPAACG